LVVSAEGQQAIDLLSPADPKGLVNRQELNYKTRTFIEALRDGDRNVLKTFLPANTSPDSSIKDWLSFEKRYGALEDVRILGTSPLSHNGFQTYVRLYFRSKPSLYRISSINGEPTKIDEYRLQPAHFSFA
jgi:hypothetical protein